MVDTIPPLQRSASRCTERGDYTKSAGESDIVEPPGNEPESVKKQMSPWDLFNSKNQAEDPNETTTTALQKEVVTLQTSPIPKPVIPPPCYATMRLQMESPSTQIILNRLMECIQRQKWSNYTQAQNELQMIEAAQLIHHESHRKAAAEKNSEEKAVQGWATALRVLSWVGTMFMLITGGTLIATGVGAVAGSMLVVGGVIMLGKHLMDVFDGWNAIFHHLPGTSPQEKAAVLSWIQISILVLSLLISGGGAVLSGYKMLGEGASVASAMLQPTARMAEGVCLVGKAKAESKYYEALAQMRRDRSKQDELHADSKDLTQQMNNALKSSEAGYQLIRWYLKADRDVITTLQKGLRGPSIRHR